MFNIIPLILILISLVVMITIVIRKFSVLANLDIESIPAEREAKFKERIISNRLKRNFFKHYSQLDRIIKPAGRRIGGFFKWFYNKLIDLKDGYGNEAGPKGNSGQNIENIFLEAGELIKKEDLEAAEEKYIEIISMDSKNIKAFCGLGRLYFERKDYNNARQTLEHALKLADRYSDNPLINAELNNNKNQADKDYYNRMACVYFDLALVCMAKENYIAALENINKALEIEANNPRYIDTKLEISIINKDKSSAMDAYEKLAKVNPDNQKLAEFKADINEL